MSLAISTASSSERDLVHLRDRAEELLAVGRVSPGVIAGQHAGREVRALALAAGRQLRAVGHGAVDLFLETLRPPAVDDSGASAVGGRRATFVVNLSTNSS